MNFHSFSSRHVPFSGSHKIVVSYQSVGDCALSLFSYSVLEISVIGVRMHGEGTVVPLHAVKVPGGDAVEV